MIQVSDATVQFAASGDTHTDTHTHSKCAHTYTVNNLLFPHTHTESASPSTFCTTETVNIYNMNVKDSQQKIMFSILFILMSNYSFYSALKILYVKRYDDMTVSRLAD